MAAMFTPIAPRAAAGPHRRRRAWLRANLFGNWMSSGDDRGDRAAVLVCLVPPFLNWAVMNAVVRPDADACQAARGIGACWGVIAEKSRSSSSAAIPSKSQWRPEVATILLLGLVVLSCIRAFWKPWLALVVDRCACRRSSC